MTSIQKIAIWALPILSAIIGHEVAHGWVASKFGDQTARLAGRLTLNPIKHIDPMGTIVVPFLMLLVSNFIFGWAKPVPVDARNLHHPRRDMAIVAAAGPVANLVMALMWGLIAKAGIYISPWLGVPMILMGRAGLMVNIFLGVLNCLPIPPLDGGRVFTSLLPPRAAWRFSQLEPYGIFILLLLMFTGVLSYLLAPLVFGLLSGITGLLGL